MPSASTAGSACARDRTGRLAGHRSRWSRHDLRPGDRGGHVDGGRGLVVIGPFALACLDMAGTTVRDDGAVDAAFTAALETVGISEGSDRYAEAIEFVRDTMGWSKADVFASLLEPEEAVTATAAFARSYEFLVAGGATEIPGVLGCPAGVAGPRGGRVLDHRVRAIDEGRVARRPRMA